MVDNAEPIAVGFVGHMILYSSHVCLHKNVVVVLFHDQMFQCWSKNVNNCYSSYAKLSTRNHVTFLHHQVKLNTIHDRRLSYNITVMWFTYFVLLFEFFRWGGGVLFLGIIPCWGYLVITILMWET